MTIETTRYPGWGVGQAFLGQKFSTQNGFAKGVSLETAMAAGNFQTLAHELGHTLFGLEDLYLFQGSSGANPTESWDMMGGSSQEFLVGANF